MDRRRKKKCFLWKFPKKVVSKNLISVIVKSTHADEYLISSASNHPHQATCTYKLFPQKDQEHFENLIFAS